MGGNFARPARNLRSGGFDHIVGRSSALLDVLKQITLVAPTDSTVLILGETGTGKEAVAQAIHEHSKRSGGPLVKINCPAIPAGLIESELFGHERGAFTGAVSRRIGRIQAADRGTLFLDEIGDLPMELQAKLLRVIQEREFECLGSSQTRHVDIRVVAATNQNLPQLISERMFRSDLFYRLNVFPISLAPLRQRHDDIPLLAEHFARVFSARMRKQIDLTCPESLNALRSRPWPGNIRELQNVIERAVILSTTNILEVPIQGSPVPSSGCSKASSKSLTKAERDHVVDALEACRWVIGGANGAAQTLGVHRTTLISKMHKLGICRVERRGFDTNGHEEPLRFRKVSA